MSPSRSIRLSALAAPLALAAALVFLLSACGGGGGAASQSTTQPQHQTLVPNQQTEGQATPPALAPSPTPEPNTQTTTVPTQVVVQPPATQKPADDNQNPADNNGTPGDQDQDREPVDAAPTTLTITGNVTMNTEAGYVVDSDTPSASAIPKDKINHYARAPKKPWLYGLQRIPNGVNRVFGHLGHTYSESHVGKDSGDHFAVPASTEQVYATLVLSADFNGTATLFRWNHATERMADMAILDGQSTPSIPLTVDGSDNVVGIQLDSGTGGSYTLSFGPAVEQASPVLSSDFAAGEYIKMPRRDRVGAASGSTRPKLVKLSDSPQIASAQPRSAMDATVDNGFEAKLRTLRAIEALNARGDGYVYSPNYKVGMDSVPSADPFAVQDDQARHHRSAGILNAWSYIDGYPPPTSSEKPVVAVLDTGFYLEHEDMEGVWVNGRDFVSSPEDANDGDGIDADPSVVRKDIGTPATQHGTHVAGIIAALRGNDKGISGIADARIMPVRVLGHDGSGSIYDVMQGMLWAAGLPNDSGTLPAERASVINLSLSTPSYSDALQMVVDEVRQAGVIIVAAAGNSSSSTKRYPAACNGVVAVSSVGGENSDTLAHYSNFGPWVDISSIGGEYASFRPATGAVLSAVPRIAEYSDDYIINQWGVEIFLPALDELGLEKTTSGYDVMYGTSQAAPHVAAMAAMMIRVANINGYRLTPVAFDEAIASGNVTSDIGAPGFDDSFGHGFTDFGKALLHAASLAGTPLTQTPRIFINRTSFSFASTIDSQVFTVENAGGGTLEVTAVEPLPDWTLVDWVSVNRFADHGTYSTWKINVDRSKLPRAKASSSLRTVYIRSNGGDIPLHISTFWNSGTEWRDVGEVTVAVGVTPAEGGPLSIIKSAKVSGALGFSFEGLNPGASYTLFAHQDIDADGNTCEANEPCVRQEISIDDAQAGTVSINVGPM